ncbi:MAG: TOBE domain-containing protein, partial [Alicyclobacillus sp.]|nr:TOBE domain-containing protein [Alicyclobacillus sp.]
LLLDEPLSALDAKVRVSLRESLKQIQATTGVTTLMVTHDQEEALELADRVAVMNQGRIEQVGTPAEIYYNPATAFTAQFIGSVTALRALVVSVREADDRSGPVATLEWAGCRFEWRVAGDAWRTGDVRTVYVRPESISVVPCAAEGFVPGRVVSRTFMGAMTRLSLDVGGERLIADVLSYQSAALVPGATAYVRVQDHRLADRQPSAGVSLGTGASLPADALAAGAASAVPVSTLSGHPAGSDPAGSGAGVAAGQAPAGSPGGPGVPGSGPVAADGAEVTG